MRNFALAISITMLLSNAFYLSFAQQSSSDFFLEISDETIDPGGTISVRISGIMEPNTTKVLMLSFLPPPGSDEVQSNKLDLRADSLGFASETVDYPKGVATASTQQPGNYTVLVQDIQSGTLLERASFKVAESVAFTDSLFASLSEYQAVVSSIVVVGAGGILTYLYSRLSAKRQTKVLLDQKKTEFFIGISPTYNRFSAVTKKFSSLTVNRDLEFVERTTLLKLLPFMLSVTN